MGERSADARAVRRPLIAIPARFSAGASALRYRAEVAAAALVEAVYDAGGEPWVMHPAAAGDDAVRERLTTARGVLLPGGGDLSPRWTGVDSHVSLYDVDETQDVFDLAVARVALADGLPLLAICRGLQVVNVARGGDLNPDIAGHRHVVHRVALTGGTSIEVSCYHHQSLGRLGKDLFVTGRAEDGTIEAVELRDHAGWFRGVQWHPEDTFTTDPEQAALFGEFVAACRAA